MQLNGDPTGRPPQLPGWYSNVGDIVEGDGVDYVVPQNPFKPVMRSAGISDIVSQGVQFVVPQNPLKAQLTGNVKPIGTGSYDCGCGCGGSGGCGTGQLNGKKMGTGMGTIATDFSQFSSDLSAGNYRQAFFTDTIAGIPTIGWVAGIVLVAMTMGASGSRRR